MNKLFLVLLAVCLVSTHAFVRRDAPAAAAEVTEQDDLKNAVDTFAKRVKEIVDKNLNPDDLKNNFNKFIEDSNKLIDDIRGKAAAEIKQN